MASCMVSGPTGSECEGPKITFSPFSSSRTQASANTLSVTAKETGASERSSVFIGSSKNASSSSLRSLGPKA